MHSIDQLICEDPERRLRLLDSDLDGIDYIEVPFEDQTHLRVYFVKGPPFAISPSAVKVTGGVRIRGIEVVVTDETKTDSDGLAYLEVTVDYPGDFSSYGLEIDDISLDPVYAHRTFGFKVGCPSDFDCIEEVDCPPEVLDTPVIDYMAKDYASFRQLLVDTIPSKIPEWTDRHEADLGMTLVELMAYEGDYISYKQDAVALEMHLETARQRESVARHVRLIDYPMHHGINAKAFVHLTVDSSGVIPARTMRCPDRTVRFLTRIGESVDPTTSLPPDPVIANQHEARVFQVADAIFEPVESVNVAKKFNEIFIHVWSDKECCLPIGSTSVDLVGDVSVEVGDLLLLEEVLGVATGLAQDADPRHRQIVRIVAVGDDDGALEDPLYTEVADRDNGNVAPRGLGDPLKVTKVRWGLEDALTFPLCVSAVDEDDVPLSVVAVARGNIVLVDHGATSTEKHAPDESRILYSEIGYRFRLTEAPLTFGFGRNFVSNGPVSDLYRLSPRLAEPHVAIVDGDGSGQTWLPEPDLLNSGRFSRSFVAEPDHDGRALIRFGDGEFGRRPSFPQSASQSEEHRFSTIYRVGNGRSGNVGRETIVHVLEPEAPVVIWPKIEDVRNPMAAWGGVDPEPIDLVKETAPDAFRAETYRAVTETDYAKAAELLPAVSRAQADFRWTGSWHTVFVTVDPKGTDQLSPTLEARVRRHLTRYKLAGHDLEVDPPTYVALETQMTVCAAPDHFRSDVEQAVTRALGARAMSDGSLGFFHPDNFTFGQPVYLSELYASVEAVTGVDSVNITMFQRYGTEPDGELAAGRIEAARLEILRLNGDINFPEHGVLRIEMDGGK